MDTKNEYLLPEVEELSKGQYKANTLRQWCNRQDKRVAGAIKVEHKGNTVWALPRCVVEQLLNPDSSKNNYSALIAEWQEFQRNGRLTKRRLEESTITLHAQALDIFWSYLKYPNWKKLKSEGKFDVALLEKNINEITPQNFEICLGNWEPVDKEKQNCHYAGKMHAYKAVRSFCKYLVKVGLKPAKILEDLQKEKPTQIYLPKRETVEKDTLTALLEKNQTNLDGGRGNYDIILGDIILKMLAFTGVRRSELMHVRLKDFSLKKKEIFVSAEYSKTHRDRNIGLRPDLYKSLARYVGYWRPRDGSDKLLLQKNGKPITESVIKGRLERLAKKLHLKRLTPHMFRRAFVTLHADLGIPISHIQEQAGHSKLATTELYIRTNNETAKNSLKNLEINEFEPLALKKDLTLEEKLALIDSL